MSATAQRFLLSFIYVHRRDIPLSAVVNFVDTLLTFVSALRTSEWIKMLLDWLKIFCSDKNCHSGSSAVENESEGDDSRDQKAVKPEDVSPKLNTDQMSSVFCLLRNDELHFDDSSSLLEPFCSEGQKMEVHEVGKNSDVETETGTEFLAGSGMTVSQPSRMDDTVQNHTGNVLC